MAKSPHSYIKRQKELKRMKKAEEKRKRRLQKKEGYAGDTPEEETGTSDKV